MAIDGVSRILYGMQEVYCEGQLSIKRTGKSMFDSGRIINVSFILQNNNRRLGGCVVRTRKWCQIGGVQERGGSLLN